MMSKVKGFIRFQFNLICFVAYTVTENTIVNDKEKKKSKKITTALPSLLCLPGNCKKSRSNITQSELCTRSSTHVVLYGCIAVHLYSAKRSSSYNCYCDYPQIEFSVLVVSNNTTQYVISKSS